jgi:anti-anti-sigma regulatory factor/anti-sigma regulatory factor (Ser/Thr protein kinase)
MTYLDANRVVVGDVFDLESIRHINATIFNAINKKGYEDLILDFSKCESINSGAMAAFCANIFSVRKNRIDFSLIPPNREALSRLFMNANWAFYIEERKYKKLDIKNGNKNIPLLHYNDSSSQQNVVNDILQSLLCAIEGLSRTNLKAVEWALNEITDNVINHSNSDQGGFVQLFYKNHSNRKFIELVVSDAGDGIPNTLKSAYPSITDDANALEMSIKEGITRNKKTNQGNGLYGAFEISRVSQGKFRLLSGHATLKLDRGLVTFSNERIPLDGTFVYSVIDISDPNILEKALKFSGNIHSPLDIVEYKYDFDENDFIIFNMESESKSFGSRAAGKPIFVKINNLLNMLENKNIVIDFSGIPVISSSFADEVFGRLYLNMGPRVFGARIKFKNTSETIDGLIDRAIIQRVKIGH